MDQGRKVWAPDLVHGFILGEIVDFGTDVITVQPLNGGDVIEAPYEAVYPSEEDNAPTVDDNCALMFLNEGTLLENLRRRYMKDEIYTFTANILLALNPYHKIDIYTKENIKSYQGKSLGTRPPHTYAIADKAYRDMRNLGLSQSIMCSGESGAGKTESTKHLLQYLTELYSSSDDGLEHLEDRILAVNPLLESFGNAKTTRNHNSSRFGKFMELHFNKNAEIIGAHIQHYLLEKSRIIKQSDKERNYQVFYRMCRGAPQGMAKALNLQADVKKYEYLMHGMEGPVDGLDDVKDFAVMEKSMTDCGLEPAEKSNVFRVTAAVLHMGNLYMEEAGDGAKVTDSSKGSLEGVAKMLGLEPGAVEKAMCFKTITIAGKDSDKGLTPVQAEFGRNALAKALYSKLFDWIVGRSNKCFPYPQDRSVNYIGVLDIAGFEYFQVNSFEQFSINFCNEKLQQFFNERVLKDEQELYVKESIKFKEVEYVDNQDVIEMIEGKGGIMDILDDESKGPRATDTNFTDKVHKTFSKHFRLQSPRKSKMAYYKKMLDNEGFVIRHFAGAVCYTTGEFMDKNNDALTHDLHSLMQTSKDPFTKHLFERKPGEPEIKKGKLTLISLGKKFRQALKDLMTKLHSTRASFVRCIKPNQKFEPKNFSGGEILSQLQCAGMVTVMDLMQGGFPSRTSFIDLYNMYKASLPPELAKLDPRTFAKALFKALGLNEDDFQFGVSKVFFRPGKFAEFDTIMKSDKENLVKLVAKVLEWLIKQRWKKVAWATVAALKFNSKIAARGEAAIVMQKVVKMFFARRTHAARAKAFAALRLLESNVQSMYATVEKLPKNKEKFKAAVDNAIAELKKACIQVQTNTSMQPKEIAEVSKKMNAMIDKQLDSIRKEQEKQKLAEEARRLKEIAAKMEAERKKKAEEDADKQRQLAEMEERKRMEASQKKADEEAALREEKSRVKAEKEAEKKEKADASAKKAAAEEAAILEQERRDQELAMRLAMDHADRPINDVLSAEAIAQKATGQAKRKKAKAANYEFGSAKQAALHKRHDLSTWKYADLRDTINTSCDVDLLEACREEFHRRLKVYHAWKSKNTQAEKEKAKRAPTTLHNSAEKRASAPAPPKKKKNERPQRFFRIPFTRPEDKKKGAKKGWWFAHFDGQWIARQMELHPEKPPVLLVAGKDDMEMCELSLDETGLARKRGAEILPREFESEWRSCGGKAYKKGGVA